MHSFFLKSLIFIRFRYYIIIHSQEWKLMSSSHCQELCQQANWLLIGSTRVNSHIRSQVSKLTQLLTMTTTHKFPPQLCFILYYYSFIVKAVWAHEATMRAQAKKMNVESLRSGDANKVQITHYRAKDSNISYMLFHKQGVTSVTHYRT